MDEEPQVVLWGKKMMIKIASDLKPNTTYSINFGDAIKDITEGNIYPNYKYVFSTGTFIDSLSYSGVVVNSFSLQAQNGFFVMLYDELEDSIPLTERPRYITKTNKEGAFTITNIAQGTYKLFALKDVNSNYLFDLPNEEIGFYSETIQIDSSSTNHLINVFTEDKELQYVSSSSNPKYGKIEVEMNREADNISIKPLGDEKILLEEINDNKNQRVFWLQHPITEKESSFVIYENSNPIDTLKVDLITDKDFKDSALVVKTNVKANFELNQFIQLTFDNPLKEKELSKIKLLEDSNQVTFQFLQDSLNSRMYYLQYLLKEKTNYDLYIESGVFEGIYGLKNDTIHQTFRTKRLSDYGNLVLKIQPNFKENYIVQLFLKENLIKEEYGSGNSSFTYNYLLSGEYKVKLMIDNNRNKKWDTGNYIEGLQPEKVLFYEGTITIQENWDNTIEWKIEDLH